MHNQEETFIIISLLMLEGPSYCKTEAVLPWPAEIFTKIWNMIHQLVHFDLSSPRHAIAKRSFSSSFSFCSRWHRSARKGHYAVRPSSRQSPQGCPRNSADVCLVEHISFPTSEGGMSAASFLHSSFLQATSAVMLWPIHVPKIPQASEHLCPAKLQTKCDICCACQSMGENEYMS